jgi:hypothetical protein
VTDTELANIEDLLNNRPESDWGSRHHTSFSVSR